MLVRPRNVAGAQTTRCSGSKVIAVRRDHHALRRIEIECFARREINEWLRLVVAGNLRAEDRIPRKFVATREIGHQRYVSVRHRCEQIFWLEARERRRDVWPGVEPVPSERQFVQS